MVRVDAGTNEALETVAANLRESDVHEFLAISSFDSREALVDDLVRRYGDRDDTFAAWVDKRPVAFGAMVETGAGVVSAGLFATEAFNAVAMPVARFVRRRLFPVYAEVFRIECVIMDGYESALRFAGLLGFRKESELHGYGKRGEKFIRFVWEG